MGVGGAILPFHLWGGERGGSSFLFPFCAYFQKRGGKLWNSQNGKEWGGGKEGRSGGGRSFKKKKKKRLE
ncbi:hypothetical protein BLX88_01320 [Bacillus obstructivus]|nr:hypothetical protein BLX88_01320 [Bacillus obstructivus]